MNATDIIRQKLAHRIRGEDVVLEEQQDFDGNGVLRGTIRHSISVENLAEQWREGLENDVAHPNLASKKAKIKLANALPGGGAKIPTALLQVLLDEMT